MDKRLLIALPLCLLILFGYQYFFVPRPAARGAGGADGALAAPAPSGAGIATAANTPAGNTKGAGISNATDSAAASPADDLPVEPKLPRVAELEEREIVIVVGEPGWPGSLRAVFTNRGGGLRELRTGEFFDRAGLTAEEQLDWKHWVPLAGNTAEHATQRPVSFALRTLPNSEALRGAPLEEELWQMRVLGEESAPSGVEFTLAPGTGVTFVKRFLFVPGKNQFAFELELANDGLATAPGPRTFELTPVAWTVADSGDSYYPEPQATAGARKHPGAEIECNSVPPQRDGSEPGGTLTAFHTLAFVGVHSKYFALLVTPQSSSAQALLGANWRLVRDEDFARQHPAEAGVAWRQIVADAQIELPLPPQGQRSKIAFDVYAGPKEPNAMRATHEDLAALHDYDLGWVRIIAAPLLFLLRLFHALCSSWGIAIILLTLLVRLVLFPINRRSQTAMSRYAAKMKRLQPKIEELKKRFERDPSKLRTEQARLMQQEGAFPPLGGCLPMFLQIPVFIGLYRALGISFDLRQASFAGWIPDLALPDRFLEINLPLPFFGTIQYLNILPPIMVGLWIWQQKMMPMPADEQAARMQKMMMFMPVMMGVFLYNYAAGLSLYMITQSGLGIFETKVIRKYWPVDDKEDPKQKKTGFWTKMMALQEQAERQRRGKRA